MIKPVESSYVKKVYNPDNIPKYRWEYRCRCCNGQVIVSKSQKHITICMGACGWLIEHEQEILLKNIEEYGVTNA